MKVARVMMAILAAVSLGIVTGAIVAAEEELEGAGPPSANDATAPANPLDLGAKEMVAPADFPGGRFAIVSDPQGATFGLMSVQQP